MPDPYTEPERFTCSFCGTEYPITELVESPMGLDCWICMRCARTAAEILDPSRSQAGPGGTPTGGP